MKIRQVFDFGHEDRIIAEEEFGVFPTLADTLVAIGVPGTGLLDDVGLGGQVHQERGVADAFVEHDVELGLAERRGDLVLDDLHPDVVADDCLSLLDRSDAADVQPQRGVELERLATRSGFRIAEHDADLLA